MWEINLKTTNEPDKQAAGLGHGGILKYIAERYPQGINDVDNDGRTPLHYAAAMRDDQHTYNTLVSLGADESVVDNVSIDNKTHTSMTLHAQIYWASFTKI